MKAVYYYCSTRGPGLFHQPEKFDPDTRLAWPRGEQKETPLGPWRFYDRWIMRRPFRPRTFMTSSYGRPIRLSGPGIEPGSNIERRNLRGFTRITWKPCRMRKKRFCGRLNCPPSSSEYSFGPVLT